MMTGEPIAVDDPGKPDVRALLERHRAFALGPIKFLGPDHAELKSMHTAEAARGLGIGRAMLTHLLGVARTRGVRRVSLETGTTAAFAPARMLYQSAGFTSCGPFAGYQPSDDNLFMTLKLDAAQRAGR